MCTPAITPVVEDKGVLFKRVAHVDMFDIELNSQDPQEITKTLLMLDPTFGGINLEDIKAAECFHKEETLKRWKGFYERSTDTGEEYG